MPYYTDDGEEINPNLFPMPQLCMSCSKKDNPNEEILCNLNRIGQVSGEEFVCFAYHALE